jgi:hypothetical protein
MSLKEKLDIPDGTKVVRCKNCGFPLRFFLLSDDGNGGVSFIHKRIGISPEYYSCFLTSGISAFSNSNKCATPPDDFQLPASYQVYLEKEKLKDKLLTCQPIPDRVQEIPIVNLSNSRKVRL